MATADFINNFMREMQFGKIEKPVKQHLKNVYAAMGIALLSCAVGGYIHLFTNIMGAGLLTSLGSIGILIALLMMPANDSNLTTRFGLLNAFAFLSGVSMGPLLEMTIYIDPSIIATAFLGTSLIFICFTVAVLLSDDRKFLALGGVLFSGLSWMILLGLMNLFFGSVLIFQVRLYLGLAIMCGFVLYDTQLIVEKCRRGDVDYIRHCLDLFLDFINIFRYLLILLSDKEKKNKRRSD